MKTITLTVPDRMAERLEGADWTISVGQGVRVPIVLRDFEARLRDALGVNRRARRRQRQRYVLGDAERQR
ncbi:hypothetical protein [Agrococcus jejuensis]|uniref:Uncharacterized protein n=1 Tax=Agrococcus jejuensis TaxID=399736 RepID=A0A1G8F048_9MICO|nr:hypothetical protein [Agrococcus jejuensis]SDH75444.1 hypothetical protein SAMN04489720_2264 [Agrococcus jejuensis]